MVIIEPIKRDKNRLVELIRWHVPVANHKYPKLGQKILLFFPPHGDHPQKIVTAVYEGDFRNWTTQPTHWALMPTGPKAAE